MADWTGFRRGRFFARYVSWDTWEEGEDYTYIVGGSVEKAALTDLKESGSIQFDGAIPDASKLLRAYYTFEDAHGESETIPISTMLIEFSRYESSSNSRSGSANLVSVLSVLKDRDYGEPFTVPAGTDAIALAVQLCQSVGLRTSAVESSYRTSNAHTFAEDDANYLSIVNWLADVAGYGSVRPDAYGTVLFEPYVEPTERPAAYTFEPGDKSVMVDSIPYENDWQSTPNAVRIYFSTETESLRAWAFNVDQSHPASLPNRGGREKTQHETASQIEAETIDERLEVLHETAVSNLISASSEIEYTEVTCPFLPLDANMSINVQRDGGMWNGSITNYNINLSDDSASTIRMRKFVRHDLQIESGSEVIWIA